MPKLFGVTLFISATLLFLVQPMVGKMILPLLGGTPAVWNTCMVFFQALLLAGYYYAHRTTTGLPGRRQVRVHTMILLLAAGALAVGAALSTNHSPVPIVKSLAPQGSSLPFFGVIGLLGLAIGLPFFTISATAPLLQKWFSETGHPSAKDPYFLYAASNLGSLIALLGYPFLVEPNIQLVGQAWVWAAGFVLLAVLIVRCGRVLLHAPPPRGPGHTSSGSSPPLATDHPPATLTQVRWLFLAAVPSSLMLAVTTDVTTDMVSMPLLWVIPLSLYLITFIIVFAKSTPAWVHLTATLVAPVLVLLVLFIKSAEPTGSIEFTNANRALKGFVYLLPFLTFFVLALACHGELARTRPSPRYLTRFYLIMSVGGVVGGLFNALIAPVAFNFVSEYPISLVAACFLLPPPSRLTSPDEPATARPWTMWDFAIPLLFFAGARFLSAYYSDLQEASAYLLDAIGALPTTKRVAMIATILAYGVPTLCSYFLVERPFRFGATVGAIWLGTFLTFMLNERKKDPDERTVYTRSFFGTMKVETSPKYRRLVHGTTVHGSQQLDPDEHSTTQALWLLGATGPADALGLAWIADPHLRFPYREPLTYYHRTGPVGLMFEAFWEQTRTGRTHNRDVGCVGLGTGSLSAYGLPGQRMSFFEIDNTVLRLVREPKYFTYLDRAETQGVDLEFIMGDARLSLEQTDRKWGFLLIDAFSSDSIPAHLLTREAVRLYFDRLSEGGLLALHISNRYLKLEPVVDQIARDGGYEAIVMHDLTHESYYDEKVEVSGKLPSTWVLLARDRASFGSLVDDPRWTELKHEPSVGLWTDDYTPITRALSGGWWSLIGR